MEKDKARSRYEEAMKNLEQSKSRMEQAPDDRARERVYALKLILYRYVSNMNKIPWMQTT